MPLSIEQIAQLAAHAAQEKKAHNVMILKISGLSIIADYFVICSGNSETHVQAVTDAVKEAMEKAGVAVRGMEGKGSARWVLMDLGDVVVHIFHKEERDFYNLERLWADAQPVDVLSS